MNAIVYLFYIAIVGLLRIYKWLELQVLSLFSPLITRKGREIASSIGIIFHCPEDPKGILYEDELLNNHQPSGTEEVNCNIKYDSLVHIKVNCKSLFPKLANSGTLACGEAYMNGTWEVFDQRFEDITEMATRVLENNLTDLYYNPWNKFLEWVELHAFNLQQRQRAFQVSSHYDLGNDLFEKMLDPWMQYTCGYWKDADNLNDAQIHKMDLLARKLDLKPGMRVLDIGCGWGTLCKYLATKYQVECVGVTIGENGAVYGNRICAGLPVDIRVQDYRQVDEKFDRIVSVGMFEHVGFRNYREFFQVCNRCLKDDGILVLHTIARNHSNVPRSEPWTNKYIFPNGNLPNPEDLTRATRDYFVLEDVHNFGMDYAKTLKCWRENFIRGWPEIQGNYGGESFFRMWIIYLSIARALFKSRKAQLWQLVMSKDGLKREYRAAR